MQEEPPSERLVGHLLHIETPHPGSNLRSRTERSPGEKPSITGTHGDVATGRHIAPQMRNSSGKNPRVTAQKGFFTSGFERERGYRAGNMLGHFFLARGCAWS